MARLISYPTISTLALGDLFPVTDVSGVGKPLKNVTATGLLGFIETNAGLWKKTTGGINYSEGNVGIGTETPTEKLQITGNVSASGDITGNNGSFTASITTPEISGNTEITGDLQVTNITADGSISANGDVGIGTTSPSYKLDVTGTGRFTSTLTCQSLVQTSQRDQKKDISDITKTKASRIPFKEYKYKSESGDRKRYGVVVEDIEAHYPELVHIDADGIKGVNYIDLLVKRVAELEKELLDISLTQGPKGDTGTTGATGVAGINGNSHLDNVKSIKYNIKTRKLEISIEGLKSPLLFTPAL